MATGKLSCVGVRVLYLLFNLNLLYFCFLTRISFNIAFKNNGINEEWDEVRYGKLLETGGGKERMTAHWVSFVSIKESNHFAAKCV
jgi:hypothetical protein